MKKTQQESDLQVRLFLWASVVVLSGIALFSVYGPVAARRSSATILALVAALTVIAVVSTAYWIPYQRAQNMTPGKPKQDRSGSFSIVSILAYLVCWSAVLWLKDMSMAVSAGVIGIILLAWNSLAIFRIAVKKTRKVLFFLMIALSWLGAALVIYFRIAR